MSSPIISVEHLSKKYRITHQGQRQQYETLRDVLAAKSKNMLARLKPGKAGDSNGPSTRSTKEDFWALKDVSFEVQQGEVLGIIGRNGAGKSTLLKILSRITDPTEGRVTTRGRVASLLEVGTGFHPELTGRENVFLNGAILGMSRAEIKRKFDEIVDFAGMEKFLDTPVKRYSSGMYVRLAFAVAAHLEPEILIVDEVLAVGDAEFQKKCLGKMQDVSAKDGRTVLFVSHNMAAVLQLTSSAIVLEKGCVTFCGPTEKAVENYSVGAQSESTVFFDVDKLPRQYPGTEEARIVSLRFDRKIAMFSPTEPLSFIAKVRAIHDIPSVRFGITLFTAESVPVGCSFSREHSGISSGEVVELDVSLSNPRLAPGRYYCGVSVGRGDHRSGHTDYDVVLDTLAFEIRPEEGGGGTVSHWARGWGSIVFPDIQVDYLSSGVRNE